MTLRERFEETDFYHEYEFDGYIYFNGSIGCYETTYDDLLEQVACLNGGYKMFQELKK